MSSPFANLESLRSSVVDDEQDDAQSVSSAGADSDQNLDSTTTSATELDISPTVSFHEKKSTDEDSLPENPFDSLASRALFDAIDQFQSCGAGEYVDIPQVRMEINLPRKTFNTSTSSLLSAHSLSANLLCFKA